MTSNLDGFISHSKALPKAVATSQEIRDRGSTFVANIFKSATPEEARAAVQHVKNVLHGKRPASHEIYAWRCMVAKSSHSGLCGPDDFEVVSKSEDDGEQWAGQRVLKVMKEEAVIDATVIVSRWFGGNLLGPIRFSHIETCAIEACAAFREKDELDEYTSLLTAFDAKLEETRSEYKAIIKAEGGKEPTFKPPVYPEAWTHNDLPKLKRLVTARESAIKSLKVIIDKKRPAAVEQNNLLEGSKQPSPEPTSK